MRRTRLGRACRRRHRHWPDRRTAGKTIPGIHPGRLTHCAALRRDRARPCPLAQARSHDGRRRDCDERAGQRLGFYSAPAGRRAHINAVMALRCIRGPAIFWQLSDQQRTSQDFSPSWLSSDCRVGPGNFTPSRSQMIRTGHSRVIRLVPSHEGCRLPLNIRVPPGMTRLTQAQRRWPAPFAPRALPRFPATTEQSAPSQRIGTFGLAVGAACAFSLGIAGQVLTFRTRARLSFAPPTCRMPLGQSQCIPQADPGGRVSPRF